MAQTLAEYLAHAATISRYVGARLCKVDFEEWTLDFAVTMMFGPRQVLRVHADGVEDWSMSANHTLLEGASRLEIVTSDPRLERAHLESLDCEGYREEYPERVIMLRNGTCWVVAEEFYVTVVSSKEWEDPTSGLEPGGL